MIARVLGYGKMKLDEDCNKKNSHFDIWYLYLYESFPKIENINLAF